jgi:N-acetyl-gamma-glutamyl-phosphate reductase
MHRVPSVTIIGASGYTGQEALDRVLRHPELDVASLGSDSLAGFGASALDPRLNGSLPAFVTNEEALEAGADLVLACLPNERAAELEPPAGAVVVDLSGAHRLREPALYAEWYGFEHPWPHQLGGWTYAVPELMPPDGLLVANPGCYATAALLALAPIRDAIVHDDVVVDAKSGTTGAGREPRASSHAGTVLENVAPYAIGAHRHAPELAQALGFPVCFVPHLLPVRRGLLATCYVTPLGDVRALLAEAFSESPVVRVLPRGVVPELGRVRHTDAAELAVFEDRATGRAIVVCAIDNLGKGAAGQAIQNANLALGLEESLGLRLEGVLV